MSLITTRLLACGMPLIVEHIPSVQSVGVTWLTPAGSASEPEDRQGVGAMLAELVFRGAGALDSRAQSDALDRLGLSRGADVHTFSLEIGATLLGARLLDALPLIVDVIRRPRLDAASIEPARDLCLQALEGLKDDPQERAMLELKARHAPAPINRSGMGTAEGLGAITRDDLLIAWAKRVRPKGSVLAIAGAVDPDAVARALDGLLTGWEGEAEAVRAGPTPPRGHTHVTDQTNQVQIGIGLDAPAEGSAGCGPMRLAAAALSGGMSCRLFTEVREKRSLCYSVSASYGPDKDFGRVIAYSGTTPERAQETLDVLWGELVRMKAGIDEGEFSRAATGLKSRIVMSGESPSARASALAQDWRKLGRPRSLDDLTETVERVTLKDVNDYLATGALTAGKATVVTLGPTALVSPA